VARKHFAAPVITDETSLVEGTLISTVPPIEFPPI